MNKSVNITDLATGRQARNLATENLSAAVRPWFADVLDQKRVQKALRMLEDEQARPQALRYLGLHCEAA